MSLIEAADCGDLETVTYLLTSVFGIDVNITDEQQRTPLFHASDKGYLEIVNILSQAGADPDISDISTNGFISGFIQRTFRNS